MVEGCYPPFLHGGEGGREPEITLECRGFDQ